MLLRNERFRKVLVRAWEACPPDNPMRFRCHEMARFLVSGFKMAGFEAVRVCDGIASYRTDYLAEMIERFSPLYGSLSFRDGFRQGRTDQEVVNSIIRIVKLRDIIDFDHSWCELFFDGWRWLVDFHPIMLIPDEDGNKLGNLSWCSAHKIELAPTDESKRRYIYCGREVVEDGRRFIEAQHPDIESWHYRVELRAMPEFL